ncbi:MAG: outer membrane lipid asymmetry maintenance protein MlaD [Pseudomonadota bacterium]
MKKSLVELYVGIFVILGIACTGYLLTVLGDLSVTSSRYYPVYAYFNSVSGLKNGAKIEMAGVEIGKVGSVSLDSKRYVAKVELNIEKAIPLTEDVIASVKTSGIIGDKYINLSPGSSETVLSPGDTIFNTESAIDIESLVSKYIFDKREK